MTQTNATVPVGTSDMPSPQTMAYQQVYKFTDLFISDLKIILKDMPYVEANRYISVIEMFPEGIPIAPLNEFIRDLGMLPYRVVAPMMKVIENKENFAKYFEKIDIKAK